MIELQKMLIPVNEFSRPGKKREKIMGIVLHWVGNAGQYHTSVGRYFELLARQDPHDENPDTYASAHYCIGEDGDIALFVPEDEIAYHAGNPSVNRYYIGIEMCHPDLTGKFTADTLAAAKLLCVDICYRYGLDPDESIIRHYDVTRKLCPKWFVEHPGDFTEFIQSVSEKLETYYGGNAI